MKCGKFKKLTNEIEKTFNIAGHQNISHIFTVYSLKPFNKKLSQYAMLMTYGQYSLKDILEQNIKKQQYFKEYIILMIIE